MHDHVGISYPGEEIGDWIGYDHTSNLLLK